MSACVIGFGIAAVLCVLHIVLLMGSYFGTLLVAALDDYEKSDYPNLYLNVVTRLLGWKSSGGQYWRYYRGKAYLDNSGKTDDPSLRCTFEPLGIFAVLGGGIAITITCPAIAISVVGAAALFYAARAGRRLQKTFWKHCKDPKAHKDLDIT